MAEKRLWFEEWFDSDFYHVLYGHRDEQEAKTFILNLVQHLQPSQNSFFLDLACGKGRHSLVISDLGYRIHGIDLSYNSIDSAKKFEKDGLTFSVGDMRECYSENTFDFVLNLFTSFGYFSRTEDHSKTLKAMCSQLKQNGKLVLDYVNVQKVEIEIGEGLEYQIQNQGIQFDIRKSLSENYINKHITFQTDERDFNFAEHVWRLHLSDFQSLFASCGFEIQTIFGDYEFNEFNPLNSERLIIIAGKK
jgi:SAM-dependent methyltransferase